MIECRFLRDGECQAASRLIRSLAKCPVTEETCQSCLKQPNPQQANFVTASVALSAVRQRHGMEHWKRFRSQLKHLLSPSPGRDPLKESYGAGTELHGMFGLIGLKELPNCACRQHMVRMNIEGPDWCLENIDTIVGWLETESKRRGLGWTVVHKSVAVRVVKLAIRRAKKKILAST